MVIAKAIPHLFGLRYDAYTQSVQVLESKASIMKFSTDIKYDIGILQEAVNKLQWHLEKLCLFLCWTLYCDCDCMLTISI